MPHDLPLTVGAALPVPRLGAFRDWLFEADRDVELQSFHFPGTIDGDWEPLAAEARRVLDGHKGRIGIHGPFWGFLIATPDVEVRAVVTKRMMQGLDVCAAVNATQMVIHSPFSTWITHNLLPGSGGFTAMIEDAHAVLDPVVARAAAQGVTLVIENVQDTDPALQNILVDSFESPFVRTSVDTGHAQIAHASGEAPPVDYFIRAAGARLHHVHLQDVDGYADRHWPPGQGSIPWHAVFGALAALDQRPRLLIELRDSGGIPEAMRYLGEAGLAV